MSYILEALKASERKRVDGQVPDLLAVHATTPPPPARPVWRYAFLGLVLTNVVGLAAWQLLPEGGSQPRQRAAVHQAPAPSTSAPAAENKPAHPAAAAQNLRPPPVTRLPAPPPAAQTLAPLPAAQTLAPLPAATVAAVQPRTQPALPLSGDAIKVLPGYRALLPVQEPVAAVPVDEPELPALDRDVALPPPRPQEAPERPAPKRPQTPTVDTAAVSYPSIDELPLSRRAELPPIQISVHSYSSSPAARAARINNTFVHEGGFVGTDLEVLEISPTGVVLRHKDLQFFVPKSDVVPLG